MPIETNNSFPVKRKNRDESENENKHPKIITITQGGGGVIMFFSSWFDFYM